MPRLHKYRHRDACYVLTAIGGAVVTFQLTAEGERRLATAGIGPDERFPRALLLDLYRAGDAYTCGSGVEDGDLATGGQLVLDLFDDPISETAFPACDLCRSPQDLHLTLAGPPDGMSAQLECAACRARPAARADTSIPLGLISRLMLARLFQFKPVAKKAPNVRQFEELLAAEFESKWAAMRQSRRPVQGALLDGAAPDELKLGT